LTPQPWSKPINRVDEAAMNHDICYLQNEDRKTRNEVCDKKMLEDLNILNPTIIERFDKGSDSNTIKGKIAVGLGQSPSFSMGTSVKKSDFHSSSLPKVSGDLVDELHKPSIIKLI
jgi:hypothetical protein